MHVGEHVSDALPWILGGIGLGALVRLYAGRARSARGRLTFEGFGASQLDASAPVDELSGQVVSGGAVRDAGFGLAEAGRRRAGWGYLYLRSDDEARRELALCREAVARGLATFYLNPEFEALKSGRGPARTLDVARSLKASAPALDVCYQGLVAMATTEIADACDGHGSPMCYPDKGLGAAAADDQTRRLIVDRAAKLRGLGFSVVRPCIFPPGHPRGPRLDTIVDLSPDVDGWVFFSALKLSELSIPLAETVAAVRPLVRR